MRERNTKQKEVILNTLMENKRHPTIQELVEEVNQKDASIGQATIYRNVKKLLKEKEIIQIPTGIENHLDYNHHDHYHIYCEKCHQIIDMKNLAPLKELQEKIEQEGVEINLDHILLTGLCAKCKGEKNEKVSL